MAEHTPFMGSILRIGESVEKIIVPRYRRVLDAEYAPNPHHDLREFLRQQMNLRKNSSLCHSASKTLAKTNNDTQTENVNKANGTVATQLMSKNVSTTMRPQKPTLTTETQADKLKEKQKTSANRAELGNSSTGIQSSAAKQQVEGTSTQTRSANAEKGIRNNTNISVKYNSDTVDAFAEWISASLRDMNKRKADEAIDDITELLLKKKREC